jgi:addiction module RelE/StbE family toxin
MHLNYSDQFFDQSKRLPGSIQNKLARLLELLAKDPFHPLLHSKKLSGNLNQSYSFRITRDWRVIFYFENPETIKLLKVGNRKDIYR